MKTNRLLGIVVVLQLVMVAGQWVSTPSLSSANAQIPDSGALRIQTVDELKSVNSKLDRLISLLESGKLQVRASLPDEKTEGK